MRTYTIRNLAVPAVLALLATALTLVYLGHGETKDAAAAGTYGVYVATHDIAAGASGDEVMHALRLVHLPSGAVVPGAVTNVSQLTGRISLAPVYRGQQLTLRAFGGVRQQGTAGQLTGTMRAIQVAGDPNQLLAGTLKNGDRVDVVAAIKVGSSQHAYGRTVLRNILVLRAPNAPSTTSSIGGTSTYSATLQLSDQQAQTLFFVTKTGDWAFMLRPAVRGRDSSDFVDSVGSVLREGK